MQRDSLKRAETIIDWALAIGALFLFALPLASLGWPFRYVAISLLGLDLLLWLGGVVLTFCCERRARSVARGG
jgi:hypothetical protein